MLHEGWWGHCCWGPPIFCVLYFTPSHTQKNPILITDNCFSIHIYSNVCAFIFNYSCFRLFLSHDAFHPHYLCARRQITPNQQLITAEGTHPTVLLVAVFAVFCWQLWCERQLWTHKMLSFTGLTNKQSTWKWLLWFCLRQHSQCFAVDDKCVIIERKMWWC